jgi:hypothetical protein
MKKCVADGYFVQVTGKAYERGWPVVCEYVDW